jgi:hypothetical protein
VALCSCYVLSCYVLSNNVEKVIKLVSGTDFKGSVSQPYTTKEVFHSHAQQRKCFTAMHNKGSVSQPCTTKDKTVVSYSSVMSLLNIDHLYKM